MQCLPDIWMVFPEDRFYNCCVILFQPCTRGGKNKKCWAAQTYTFLFLDLEGQVSVKVDRSKRERAKKSERECQKVRGRGYMTDNQVDRKQESPPYHKDRCARNKHKITGTDRQRDSRHIRWPWALCLNVTKHNGSLRATQIRDATCEKYSLSLHLSASVPNQCWRDGSARSKNDMESIFQVCWVA